MSEKKDYRYRVTFPPEIGERLEAYMERTKLPVNEAIVGGMAEYLAAWTDAWKDRGQNWPGVRPELATPSQVVEPPAVKDPLKGAKAHDTDEILALIRAVNELPASTELSGDMVFVNAERRATIHRQIAVLRRAVEEKRPEAV